LELASKTGGEHHSGRGRESRQRHGLPSREHAVQLVQADARERDQE
jgi:hypothetical protein